MGPFAFSAATTTAAIWPRFITVGRLDGRMIVMVWTPAYAGRHVISMRKANAREQKKYGSLV